MAHIEIKARINKSTVKELIGLLLLKSLKDFNPNIVEKVTIKKLLKLVLKNEDIKKRLKQIVSLEKVITLESNDDKQIKAKFSVEPSNLVDTYIDPTVREIVNMEVESVRKSLNQTGGLIKQSTNLDTSTDTSASDFDSMLKELTKRAQSLGLTLIEYAPAAEEKNEEIVNIMKEAASLGYEVVDDPDWELECYFHQNAGVKRSYVGSIYRFNNRYSVDSNYMPDVANGLVSIKEAKKILESAYAKHMKKKLKSKQFFYEPIKQRDDA